MFKRLLKLFKEPYKELPEEELKKQTQKNREEALLKASRLKKLIYKDGTGWNDFKEIIQDYIDECYIRKLKTKLHRANPKELKELELFDSDIEILQWVLQIPEQFIESVENYDG